MNDAFKIGLGRAIRMQRAACGLTKQRLSLMVGVNRITLRKIEQGEANPTLDVLRKIADGLETPLHTLIAAGEQEACQARESIDPDDAHLKVPSILSSDTQTKAG